MSRLYENVPVISVAKGLIDPNQFSLRMHMDDIITKKISVLHTASEVFL